MQFPRPSAVGPVLAALAVATASILFTSDGTAAAATPSAATLYRQAIATTKNWSVHYASAGTHAGTTILESGDAGPTAGTQNLLVGKSGAIDQASLVVIGGITYMNGNARALGDLTGLSASQAADNAGKWLQFATANQAFSQAVGGVRSHDVAEELALKGPYSLGPERILDGLLVIPIHGTQHFPGLKPMHAVLFVRAKGSHVPVEEDTITASGQLNGLEHTLYSKWGETVRPIAPMATITIGPVGVT